MLISISILKEFYFHVKLYIFYVSKDFIDFIGWISILSQKNVNPRLKIYFINIQYSPPIKFER